MTLLILNLYYTAVITVSTSSLLATTILVSHYNNIVEVNDKIKTPRSGPNS